MGSPTWENHAYTRGVPLDWIVSRSVPHDGLRSAIDANEGTESNDQQFLTRARLSTESLLVSVEASGRNGLSKLMQVILDAPQGQALVVSETAPDRYELLHLNSTDEEI